VILQKETLYKRGVKGEVRCWRMELDADNGQHRVVSGILGGAETPSGWTKAEAKNTGKKNATSPTSQAIAEVENLYAIKRGLGYFDDVAEIDNVPFTKPMLAQDWEKRKAKVPLDKGVYAQPKLDGIRCIARADGLWTRTGKPITAVPHIANALKTFFEDNPDAILDGELYNHDLRDDFNTITSIVRKEQPSAEELQQAEHLIEYHVYDLVDTSQHFSGRRDTLSWVFANLLNNFPKIKRVETEYVTRQDSLDGLYGMWLAAGYEGQMIRLDAVYENKRSNALMKRKDFVTDEFKVIRVEEGNGNWAGAIKRFVVECPSAEDGECEATPRGSYEDMKALLDSGQTPDWATVRYFGYTEAGKLRFPIVVDYGFGKRAD
jgi:DNA ligase 1